MTEVDRANLLHDLNSRHDELLLELDSLERDVEQALLAIRPPAVTLAAPTINADPGAPTC